jgi:hypothetical protein
MQLSTEKRRQAMRKCIKVFVGTDVHKDSIDVAIGEEGGREVRHYGAMGGDLTGLCGFSRRSG